MLHLSIYNIKLRPKYVSYNVYGTDINKAASNRTLVKIKCYKENKHYRAVSVNNVCKLII